MILIFINVQLRNRKYMLLILIIRFLFLNEMYIEITFENLESFREFKNKRDKKQYWKLLSKEIDLIDEHELLSSAEKLYRIVTNNPESFLAKRCCNFRLLEEKYLSYKK